jgi:hypothetical protein
MSSHVTSGKHPRRNMWGEIRLPSHAYENFKSLRNSGFYHPAYTWSQCCKAYRKKIRKNKIAKYARKGMRKRVKRAR